MCGVPPNGVKTDPIPANISKYYLDRYTYSCQEGYATDDDLCVVCDSDGIWYPNAPNCTGNNPVQSNFSILW